MKKELRFTCDKWMWRRYNIPFRKIYSGRCGRKPYCEVYPLEKQSWSYLCRWHYILDRIYSRLTRNESHAYYILEENDIEGFDKYDI